MKSYRCVPISTRLAAIPLAALALSIVASSAHAQGCVAAHSSEQPIINILSTNYADGNSPGPDWLHRLTFNVGYRVFNSNKYFVGTEEIYRAPGHVVENHQNIFDVNFNFRLSHRWSVIGDLPIFNGTRNQPYPPSGVYQVSGLGDFTVGAQAWVFRPPTERGGNVAFTLSLKIPTGIDNATGTALLNGQQIKATADQSLQPGDGGWGFVFGTHAYKRIWFHTTTYFQGQWLFNPRDTNRVATFRTQPGQSVMSVTDQYLFLTGLSHRVPKVRGLSASLGVRDEGVPVRDAFGPSDGFRRPGYIFSLDPGIMYTYKHNTLSVNGPWALIRNREPSVPELANGLKGDAFFADYTILVGLSHHF